MMAVSFLTFLHRIPSCGPQSITKHHRFGAFAGASVLASGGLRQSSLHSTKENIRHGLMPQSKSGVYTSSCRFYRPAHGSSLYSCGNSVSNTWNVCFDINTPGCFVPRPARFCPPFAPNCCVPPANASSRLSTPAVSAAVPTTSRNCRPWLFFLEETFGNARSAVKRGSYGDGCLLTSVFCLLAGGVAGVLRDPQRARCRGGLPGTVPDFAAMLESRGGVPNMLFRCHAFS